MKTRNFFNALIFTVIMIVVYALSYLVPSHSGLQRYSASTGIFIIRILLSCFWLAGITYNTWWDKSNLKTKRTKILFILLLIFALNLTWVIHTTYNLTNVYLSLKQPSRGWRNNPHQPDDLLGFKPIPNATGFHTFPVGDDIPMKYDENGFRIPVDYDHSQDSAKHPRMLFLGCSFTYGDACKAEETFPFLTEKKLNGYAINAGVCSYGLSQMYVLAQKLIPKYKPDIVVFQHSPWLVERALGQFAPVYSGVLPTPYFDKTNSVVPPLFGSAIFSYPADYYKHTSKKISDYISFLTVSFPLSIKDDLKLFRSKLGQLFLLIPKPSDDEPGVEQFVIHRVNDLCKLNNCKLIILDLSSPNTKEKNYPLDKHEKIAEVNADSSLYAHLASGETFEKKYYHYRMSGKDSILVDTHPNPAAHKIIADEIVRMIQLPDIREH